MKSGFFRCITVVCLMAIFTGLATMAYSGTPAIPEKYKKITDKKWIFTKCIYEKKDMTREYLKNNSGVKDAPYYIFRKDGTAETNMTGSTQVTWSFDKDTFKITIISDGSPATLKYTIGKLTDKDLQLDQEFAKMSLIYKAME